MTGWLVTIVPLRRTEFHENDLAWPNFRALAGRLAGWTLCRNHRETTNGSAFRSSSGVIPCLTSLLKQSGPCWCPLRSFISSEVVAVVPAVADLPLHLHAFLPLAQALAPFPCCDAFLFWLRHCLSFIVSTDLHLIVTLFHTRTTDIRSPDTGTCFAISIKLAGLVLF